MRPMPRTSPIVFGYRRFSSSRPVAQQRCPCTSAFVGEVLVLDDVDASRSPRRTRSGCRRTSRWCSAFSESAISGVAIVHAERQAVRDALGHRHDVGLDAPVLDAPHLAAGAAEAGLHLVADEQAAVLADDVDRDLEVLRRRRDEAADALDRLGEEAGDPAGRRRLDQLLDVLRALDAAATGTSRRERAAVAVRRRRVLDRRRSASARARYVECAVSDCASIERPE